MLHGVTRCQRTASCGAVMQVVGQGWSETPPRLKACVWKRAQESLQGYSPLLPLPVTSQRVGLHTRACVYGCVRVCVQGAWVCVVGTRAAAGQP